MTELRRQLQVARDAHQAARYPGDLAADARGAVTSRTALLWQICAGVGAVAALVAFVVWLGSGRVEMPSVAVDEIAHDELPQFAFTTFPALSVPQQPAEMSFSVESPSFVFAAPSFPSLEDNGAVSKPTTKESI